MAEARKIQQPIDFDEIERQIRDSARRPSAVTEDPLAELARLVGHTPAQSRSAAAALDPRLEDAIRSLESFLVDTREPRAAAPRTEAAPVPLPEPILRQEPIPRQEPVLRQDPISRQEPALRRSALAVPPEPTHAPESVVVAGTEVVAFVEPVAAPVVSAPAPAVNSPGAKAPTLTAADLADWQLRSAIDDTGRAPPVDLDEANGRIVAPVAQYPADGTAVVAAATATRPAPADPLEPVAVPAPPFSETAVAPASQAPEAYAHPIEPALTADPYPYEPEDGDQPRSRKGLFIAAALLGVAAVGVAGALTFRGGPRQQVMAGGDPPLVRAASTPIKTSPIDPGGANVPNQGRGVLQPAKPPAAPSRVASSEEQPVDVKALVPQQPKPRVVLAAPGGAEPPKSAEAAVPPATPLGQPRPVRTVTIRPGAPTAPAVVAATPPEPPAKPKVTASTTPVPPTAPIPPASPVPPAPPAVVGSAPPEAPVPARPTSRSIRISDVPPASSATPTGAIPAAKPRVEASVPAKPAAAAPKPVEPPAPPAGASEKPDTPDTAAPVRTVAKPKAPVRPKVAKKLTARADTPGAPLNIAPGSLPVRTASAEPPAAAAPRSGGTAVQIASALSEEEARSTMSRMRGRFPELAGAALGIQRAQVNGATRFRVRATGLSADAAQQLCSSLKGKGAACFVTR